MGQTTPPPDAREELLRKAKGYEDQARNIRDALGDVEAPAPELPTLARAVAGFLGRREAAGPGVLFPWPGTPAELPPDKRGELRAGDVLPPEGDPKGATWGRLWELAGPLWPDRLAVLVGATGRGKSGFALQAAEAAARAGNPVLYLSAEMGTDELLARLIALRARERGDDDRGIAWRSVLMGGPPPGDLKRACEALVKDCPHLYPWAPRAGERTAGHLAAMVRAVVKAEADRPPLVVVDYLQRMAEGDDLRGAVREVSGTLRDLSRPGGLGEGWPGAAVLALSSTARANYQHFQDCKALKEAWEGGKRDNGDGTLRDVPPVPLEGMGKESGELETDAALLLVMTTNKGAAGGGDGPGPRNGLLVVAKNRTGACGLVEMTFLPACGRFTELEPLRGKGETVPTKRPRKGKGKGRPGERGFA